MNIEKIKVTPEMAGAWLKSNLSNRRLDPNRLKKYVSEMENGRWKEDTFEVIKFDTQGNLIDGQHRLTAICKSGVSINLHVVFGLNNEVMNFIDTGKSRQASDVLTINGVKNSTKIAGFIQRYHLFINLNSKAQKSGIENCMSNSQVVDFYNENKDFIEHIIKQSDVLYSSFQRVIDFGTLSLFYAVLIKIDSEKGEKFMQELCTGADVTNDVIIILRNRLIAEKVGLKKTSKQVIIALIIKAWNNYYTYKKVKVLRFQPDVEAYPILIGLK
jgi:hypothetical protein